MSLTMRAMFIICAVLVLGFVIRKIKKCQMQAMDSTFWLFFSFSFVLVGVFPEIPAVISSWLGFMSASNFVFLYVIAVLVIRDFANSIRLSKQEQRLSALAQEIALRGIDE